MIVYHDQDGVFTGYASTAQLLNDQVPPSYTLRDPQENPEGDGGFHQPLLRTGS